jgi:hypothetical protein
MQEKRENINLAFFAKKALSAITLLPTTHLSKSDLVSF